MERRESIALSGDLRTDEKRLNIREILDEKWESGVENLEVDLSQVTAIDFDSLTELLITRNRFIQAGTMVEFKNIPDAVKRILEIFRVPVSGSQ